MALTDKARTAMVELGEMSALAIDGMSHTLKVRMWWREYVDQALFFMKVTTLPVMAVALPLGATVALQVGALTRQLGAQSVTGSAVMLGIVQQAAPLAAALLVAGAGGSAIASDMGARNIRDELAAMEVMAVDPVPRLVTPRLWAAGTIAMCLVPLVILAGVGGGWFFNVVLQGVSPGSYFGGATDLLQIADLFVALFKAFLFGVVAAAVACYRGMTCDRSPSGVGVSVRRSVVFTVLVVFAINYVVTTLYYALVPQKI